MIVSLAAFIGHVAGIAGRMTEFRVDDRDRRLLDLLRRDARQPIVALAKALNLSRSATQERLAKLQSTGVIDGFTVRDGSKVGARQSAYLMVSFESGYRCAQVVPKLLSIPSLGMIHSVTGPIDLGFGRRSVFVLVVNVANLPLDLTPYDGDPAGVKPGGEGELTITITSGGTDIPVPNVPAAIEP